MLQSILNTLFGCSHTNTTFPLTPGARKNAVRGETYVVCLDCGREFAYDWDGMRIGRPVVAPAPVVEAQAVVR